MSWNIFLVAYVNQETFYLVAASEEYKNASNSVSFGWSRPL